MGFRDDEIRVEIDEELLADGLTIDCPACGHVEWMHPQVIAPDEDPFFCGECGHIFGSWGEVHRRLFTAAGMLDAVLKRKP